MCKYACVIIDGGITDTSCRAKASVCVFVSICLLSQAGVKIHVLYFLYMVYVEVLQYDDNSKSVKWACVHEMRSMDRGEREHPSHCCNTMAVLTRMLVSLSSLLLFLADDE